MKQSCTVYRCSKQEEMYLYVSERTKPEALPAGLLQLTGRLVQVMELDLHPERKLARVDVLQVMEKLADPGYFLQMPPEGNVQVHLHQGD